MALPKGAAEIIAKQVNHGGVDPNVKIPQQILDAGKRSEAIQHAIAGTSEPSVAAQLDNNQAPPAQVNPQQEEPAQVTGADAPPPDDGTSRPVDWERQFKSLAGRAEAEAKRAREAVTSLSQRLEQIERENQSLKLQTSAPVHSNGGTVPSSLSEQEIADYGPELIDVVRRVAAETAGPLNEEINRLRAQMGHVQEETGNSFLQRMNTTLEGMIPRWSDLNRDPRFIQWSQLPDIFSGAIRKTLMQDAWNSGDPHRVAAFFQAYLAEEAATNPQGQGQPRVPSPSRMVVSDTPLNPQTPGAPLDLASLAAPGRAHSAGGQPAEKHVYTAAEITRFYTDVAAGRYRGRENDQRAIDNDIMMAQREGRIISDQRTQLPRDPYMR